MGSLVAELAEKLSSATNNFDIDEGTMYVNTSADTVGIGTTTPDGKLSVHQSASADIMNLYDGTTNILTVEDGGALTHKGSLTVGVDDTGHDVKFFGATSGAYMLWDESTDDLILGGAARLGIGITSPSQNLDVLDTAQIIGAEGTSASLYLVADEGDDNGDGWRINSNQDVNDLTISNNTSGSYVDKLTIATNGDVTATGDMNAVDFNATSDATLKENIRPLDDVLSLIENINTYKFNWIESKGGKESVGVLAQELEDILPSAVNTKKDNDQEHMTVNYNQITSVLIQAVKELSNKVKELSVK